MTLQEQITNWLTIGFEQPTGSLTEVFYYDRRDNEFFSVVVADYFMFDENMNYKDNVSNTYTKTQEYILLERMQRIFEEDPQILEVPRVTIEERQAFMKQFLKNLTDTKLIKTLNKRISKLNYRSNFNLFLEGEADELTRQNWEEEKMLFLLQKVDTFLNINNINIETTTLWFVEGKITISVDLTKDNDKEE